MLTSKTHTILKLLKSKKKNNLTSTIIKGKVITLISKILVSTAVYCVLRLELRKTRKQQFIQFQSEL